MHVCMYCMYVLARDHNPNQRFEYMFVLYMYIYIYISKVHQDRHTFNSGRDKASQHDHDHSHPGGTNHHLSHDHMNPSNNQLINIYNLNTDETTLCPPPEELLQVTEHIIKSYDNNPKRPKISFPSFFLSFLVYCIKKNRIFVSFLSDSFFLSFSLSFYLSFAAIHVFIFEH